MKRIIPFLLTLTLVLLLAVGCEKSEIVLYHDRLSKYFASTAVADPIEGEDSTTQQTRDPSTVLSNTTTSTAHTAFQTVTKVNTTESFEVPMARLPEVKFSVEDKNVRYMDMTDLPDGGYVVCGDRFTETDNYSIIRQFDKNSNLISEHSFKKIDCFNKIEVCSSGGFIAASYYPPCVTKINNNFETEWCALYESEKFWGMVQDIEEITPDLIAVSFVSINSPESNRQFKLAFLNNNGDLIETIDLMKSVDQSTSEITPDGKGGFYLLTTCNESLAEKYPLVKEKYDRSKGTEIIVMHFSADRTLTDVKTFGGGGDDWLEEGTIDENGNLYIAVGTQWNGNDSFWEMNVDQMAYIRRMLVKLEKNGEINYKAPLSYRAMGVDQIFGIHTKGNDTYVVGMSDYFDDYQTKYPCEQIPKNEQGDRIFCVYAVRLDCEGNELDRWIFRCDINNTPCDSLMLSNGFLAIAGSVSSVDNPFDLEFPSDVDYSAAMFLYAE